MAGAPHSITIPERGWKPEEGQRPEKISEWGSLPGSTEMRPRSIDISRHMSFDTPYLEPDDTSPMLGSVDAFALENTNLSPNSFKNRGPMSLLNLPSLDGSFPLAENQTAPRSPNRSGWKPSSRVPRMTTIMSEGNLQELLDKTERIEQIREEFVDRDAVMFACSDEFAQQQMMEQLDEIERQAVFATYKAEFGSKSHTAQVIAAINKKAQIAKIREDFIDREAVFASYAQEFGTKSKTHRMIEELDKQDAAHREAVFAQYQAEFGTKSKTRRMIEELDKQDAADREAVFAQYQAEFGTKSKTHHVIEELDKQDAADREAVFATYKAEFGSKSHTAQVIAAINKKAQ